MFNSARIFLLGGGSGDDESEESDTGISQELSPFSTFSSEILVQVMTKGGRSPLLSPKPFEHLSSPLSRKEKTIISTFLHFTLIESVRWNASALSEKCPRMKKLQKRSILTD